jgi:hypothetical protein
MKARVSAVEMICLLLILIFVSPSIFAQQIPAPAPQLQSTASLGQILSVAVRALTSSLPNDVMLRGSMQIEAGGRSETATLTVAARGTSQSYEVVSGQYTQSTLVFSQGQAAKDGTPASLELACTAQSPLFPASLLTSIAADTDTSGAVVGIETVDGLQLLHFRTWKNFPAVPNNDLSSFTQRDWWIDPASGLIRKLAFERRAAGGATAGIHYEYQYDSFQSFSNVLVPTSIRQAVNGTPYATITFNSTQMNTGLTDQDFPVQ